MKYFREEKSIRFAYANYFFGYLPQRKSYVDVNYTNFKKAFKSAGIFGDKLFTHLGAADRTLCYFALDEIHHEP